MALSLSFARYSDLLVENRKIFIPHLYLAPPQGGNLVGISGCLHLILIKSEWLAYRVVKKTLTVCWVVSIECRNVTDRRTEFFWRAIKSGLYDRDHTPLRPIFLWLVFATIHLLTNFEMSNWSASDHFRGRTHGQTDRQTDPRKDPHLSRPKESPHVHYYIITSLPVLTGGE